MNPSARDIFIVHRVSGGGVLKVREFLNGSSPELRARVIMAAHEAYPNLGTTGVPDCLVDPLERDPEVGENIRRVMDEEHERFLRENNRKWPRGGCFVIWRRVKIRLLREHQIEWFSRAEMNPFTIID